MNEKIITENVFPPIPTRQFDWCAWFDGHEESGPYGWGVSKDKAIAELLQTQGLSPDRSCSYCGRFPQAVKGCGVAGCPIGEDA